MAVDKSLDPFFGGDDFDMGPEGLMLAEEEMASPESLVTELDDGGVEIDFDPMAPEGDVGSSRILPNI